MTTDSARLCPGCFADTAGTNPCPHCGFDDSAPRPMQALPLRTVLNGQFLVGRVLGKPGGFGITYLAWDQMLRATVAIKEYLPRELAVRAQDSRTLHPHSHEETDLFRYGLEQFLNEARTLAQLDHPNLVRVRQFFEANGTAYLVMDYYRGCSLAEHLETQPNSRMNEPDALALMQPILDGLRAVHAKGFLHRDIKPQNIYLAATDSGGVRPILLDFGAARQSMGEHSRSLSVVISPGYAPFEQYHRKGQQGPVTDIYGAAAVLYRMLTGTVPPEATERMAGDELRQASTFGIRPPISAALTQALAMKMDERPASVEAFQQGLQSLVAHGDGMSPAGPGAEQHPEELPKTRSAPPLAKRRLSWIGAGVVVGVLVGVSIAITMLSQTHEPSSPPVPEPVVSAPMPEPALLPESQTEDSPMDQQEVVEQPETSPPPADELEEVVEIEPELPPAQEPEAMAETNPSLPPEAEPETITAIEPASQPEAEAEAESLPEIEPAPSPPLAAVDVELLETCREHMEKMRYTHPEDDNALLCYQAVQRQDPENIEAEQAFEKMTAFYLDSGRRALKDGDYERLFDRIERLRKIDPNSLSATQFELGITEIVSDDWLKCAQNVTNKDRKRMKAEGISEGSFWGMSGPILSVTHECGYLNPPKNIPKWTMDSINEKCYWRPDTIDYAGFYRQFYEYHPDYFEKVLMNECARVYALERSRAKREAEKARMSR